MGGWVGGWMGGWVGGWISWKYSHLSPAGAGNWAELGKILLKRDNSYYFQFRDGKDCEIIFLGTGNARQAMMIHWAKLSKYDPDFGP